MPNPEGLISTIRAELARKGLVQRDVAEKLGISVAGISDRFNGHTRISVDELLLIAELLDVPASLLLGEPERAAS